MPIKQVISPLYQVSDAAGRPVKSGFVHVLQPGTTDDYVPAFKDSGLLQPHEQPIKLTTSGRVNVWVTENCDIRVTDRNGNLVAQELNANPETASADASGGLLTNGSFEVNVSGDGTPDGWTLTSETGANNGINTAENTDGENSFAFTSSGNGGGALVSENFFPVNSATQLRVEFDTKATVATVRNIVRVEWYDVSQVIISSTDVYDSQANPTDWTTYNLAASPPANARFAKVRLIGIDPSVELSGTTYFDRVSAYYPQSVTGIFDNITLTGNTISSTDTDGDLILDPDGTGQVILKYNDLDMVRTLAASSGGLQINNTLTGGGFERAMTTGDVGETVQAWDTNLDQIAALAPSSNNVMLGNGSAWVLAAEAAFKAAMNLEIGTDVQAYDANLGQIAALTPTDSSLLVGNGSAWVLESGATLRTSLGLAIGTDVQAYDADLTTLGGLAKTDGGFVVGNGSSWVLETGATARASMGAQAQSNRLDEIAALTPTDGNILVGNGSSWTVESGATARASLGLAIGTDVQALNANLNAISSMSPTNNNFIVGNGSAFALTPLATVQSILGLGSIASKNITVSTSDPSGTPADGDIWIKYVA